MNVYEAIATSPLNMAWHEKSGLIRLPGESCIRTKIEHPDGWQPLAVLEDAEQWKQRAEKAEAQLYESCRQLAGEYVLGEPLTELITEQMYIAIRKSDGKIEQGTWKKHQYDVSGCMWTYYADPRPLPKLPEKKPRYTYRDCGECFRIARDEKDFCAVEYRADAEHLVRLLNESEAKDD